MPNLAIVYIFLNCKNKICLFNHLLHCIDKSPKGQNNRLHASFFLTLILAYIKPSYICLEVSTTNLDPIPFCKFCFVTRSPCNPQIAQIRVVYQHVRHAYSLLKYMFRANDMAQKVKVPATKSDDLSLTPGFTW